VVDELGNARLGDPGLLGVLAKSPLIVSGTMTVPYRWMAPELMENPSAKPNSSTDVYSVTMTSLVFIYLQIYLFLDHSYISRRKSSRRTIRSKVLLTLWFQARFSRTYAPIGPMTLKMASGPCGTKDGTRIPRNVRTWQATLSA